MSRGRAHLDFERFFALTPDLFAVLDADGHFLAANPAWERWAVVGPGGLVGRSLADWVADNDRQRVLAELRACSRATTRSEFEADLVVVGGETRTLGWLLEADGKGNVAVIARQSATLREAEERLERARELADAAGAARTQFLSNLSHEFRTPLNSVLGFTSILLEESEGMSDRHHGFLERIQSNGRDLLFLINEILDLARIESGTEVFDHEPADLSELMRQVAARVRLQAEAKGLDIQVEVPAGLQPFATDARRLKQVLTHLAGNAVKFTASGRVTLRVVASREGLPVALEVEDTGIGISYEQQDRVFVAFQQADGSASRRYAGAGLGLSVARALCDQMGLPLTMTSQLGSGTRFRIQLAPEDRPARSAEPGRRRRR
jgi:signal transduction histidine kinase